MKNVKVECATFSSIGADGGLLLGGLAASGANKAAAASQPMGSPDAGSIMSDVQDLLSSRLAAIDGTRKALRAPGSAGAASLLNSQAELLDQSRAVALESFGGYGPAKSELAILSVDMIDGACVVKLIESTRLAYAEAEPNDVTDWRYSLRHIARATRVRGRWQLSRMQTQVYNPAMAPPTATGAELIMMLQGQEKPADLGWLVPPTSSYSWAGVSNLHWFAFQSGRVSHLSNIYSMGTGDFLQYNYDSNDQWDHSQPCQGRDSFGPVMANWNDNYSDRRLRDILSKPSNANAYKYATRT